MKYLLISLLVPLGQSICLLICRNKGYEKVLVPNPVDPTYPEVTQVEATELEATVEIVEETVEEVNVEETTSEE